jgi:hypothetical protein
MEKKTISFEAKISVSNVESGNEAITWLETMLNDFESMNPDAPNISIILNKPLNK